MYASGQSTSLTRRLLPAVLVSACFLLLYTPATAQLLWPEAVDTVRVYAPRPGAEERLARRSGFATVIPLGMEVSGGRDLADLLDRACGVRVHRYGGLGSFSLARVRGSTPGQVSVCLDGVPIAGAADGLANLAILPVSQLERAELYRGPQTASFGGPPAAGILNLVTPEGLAVPLHLSAGAGSFGTAFARGQWGSGRRAHSILLSGQHRRTTGDFEYLDTGGTPHNTEDDRLRRRANNDSRQSSFLWKGRSGLPGLLSAEYTGQNTVHENGVAGPKSTPVEHVRYRTSRSRHQAGLTLRPAIAYRPWLELSGHAERIRDRYRNPDGELGLGSVDMDNRTREEGGRVSLSSRLLPLRQEARAAIEWRREVWVPTNRIRGTTGFERTRRHRTVSLEDRIAIGRLTVEGAYLWVRAADNYDGPVVWGREPEPGEERVQRHEGTTWGGRYDLGRGLVIKGNRGRMTRFPTFHELFGINGIQDGNPKLRPEKGAQWDLGLSWAPVRPWRLESVYFERLVEDQIYLLQNSQRTVKPDNLDRAWTRGVETSAYYTFRPGWGFACELSGNHTWQEAIDLGRSRTYRDKWIPNTPRHQSHASLWVRRGLWGVRWETSDTSSSYWHRYNKDDQKTPGGTIHDLTVERSLSGGRVRLRVEARNITDDRLEDIEGYPLPGRNYVMEVSWTP